MAELPRGLLGGHVTGGPHHLAGVGQAAVRLRSLGQAEVGHVGSAVGVEQDVGRLQVPVKDATPVGEVDVGFGPARVLTSQQVSQLAAALAPIEPDEVARRVDLTTFDQEVIYPGNWQRDGIGVDYVLTNYRQMRDLIGRVAKRGEGLVLYIN